MDKCRVDVLADNLPCRHGKQFAIAVIFHSSLTALGDPRPRATTEDGAVALDARADKEAKYPELVQAGLCELAVVELDLQWFGSHCELVPAPLCLPFSSSRRVCWGVG